MKFNSINKKLSQQYHAHYIDITLGTEAIYSDEFIAADGLHHRKKNIPDGPEN